MTTKYTCVCADHRAEFTELAGIVRKAYRVTHAALRNADNYSTVPHTWHVTLQNEFNAHPVVLAMLEAHRPAVMVDLMFEWPHVSEKDPAMLAYTRDDSKGETDVQTLTSIGKYVARHWPKVPDHVRRDACLLYTPDKMQMTPATTEAIIHAIQNGPMSCMKGSWNVHPYSVYTPAFGWGMAVRLNGEGRIDGRALTWTNPDDEDDKIFARTYARKKDDPEHGHSHADQVLAAWLEAQGFSHEDWPEGAQLARRTHRNGDPLLPYIDGDNQHVRGGGDCWVICDGDSDAEYKCDNTNGTADAVEEENEYGDCEDCECRLSQDEYYYVGRDEDCRVCEGCCDMDYTRVTGMGNTWGGTRRAREYYVPNDDVARVGGNDYDAENLPDNIVPLQNGDYADIDDCSCVDDEWYLSEDCVTCADGEWRLEEDCTECADGKWRLTDDCTECTDDGESYPTDECWQCGHSGDWYSSKVEPVELDGVQYHPDSVAEMRAETQVAPLFEEATA